MEVRLDLGDGSASDATVWLASADGRKTTVAGHSSILAARCRYFAVKLAAAARNLADSQGCKIEIVCSERDFDHHIIFLKLLYAIHAASSSSRDSSASVVADECSNVSNAIGVMRVASTLGSQAVLEKCLEYVEAVPWSDREEEEILQILRGGIFSIDHPVLARLQPVDPALLREVFLSAFTAATRGDDDAKVKACAQEQIEYMLVEDEDAPLITSDNHIKPVVREKFRGLFLEFKGIIAPEDATQVQENEGFVLKKLADLAWACRVLSILSLLDELVLAWCEASADIICFLQDPARSSDAITLKAVEITSKVLDAVGYGTVLIPPTKRTGLLQAWLPFMRRITRLLMEIEIFEDTIAPYNNIQSAMNSLVLSLPAEDQAAIFTDWMKNKCMDFPDLSEAFEVWCFRTKSAKRRFNGC